MMMEAQNGMIYFEVRGKDTYPLIAETGKEKDSSQGKGDSLLGVSRRNSTANILKLFFSVFFFLFFLSSKVTVYCTIRH